MYGPKGSSSKIIIRGPMILEIRVVGQGEVLNSKQYQLLEFSCCLWHLSVFSLTLASDSRMVDMETAFFKQTTHNLPCCRNTKSNPKSAALPQPESLHCTLGTGWIFPGVGCLHLCLLSSCCNSFPLMWLWLVQYPLQLVLLPELHTAKVMEIDSLFCSRGPLWHALLGYLALLFLNNRLYMLLTGPGYRTLLCRGVKDLSMHTRGQTHRTSPPCLFGGGGNNPFGMDSGDWLQRCRCDEGTSSRQVPCPDLVSVGLRLGLPGTTCT